MTWESYWAWVWLLIETHIGVVCASAPSLKLFFKKLLQVSTMTGGSWLRRTGKSTDAEASFGNTDVPLTQRTQKSEKSYVGKTGWWETTIGEQTVDFDDQEFQETKTLPATSDFGNASDQDERPLHPTSPTLWEESSRKYSPKESDFHVPRRATADEGRGTFYIDK
jgi:hypothetical protein